MIIVLFIPIFLSALMLGAHFFRYGSILIAIICCLIPFVLLVKRAWAARIMQLFFVLGVIEWITTLMHLVSERRTGGQPWIRLVLILGFVIVATGSSALIFSFSRTLRKRYGLVPTSQK